jgi:hypothetical protein
MPTNPVKAPVRRAPEKKQASKKEKLPMSPIVQVEQQKVEQQPATQAEQMQPVEQMPQSATEQAPVQQEEQGLLSRFMPKKKLKAIPAPIIQKDETTKKIETLMSEDMVELYEALPPIKKVEFRKKGEEAAGKIRILMRKPKLSLKKLLKILLGWLQVIPGVNKFFLEQEAKIKAEKLVELHEEEKKH